MDEQHFKGKFSAEKRNVVACLELGYICPTDSRVKLKTRPQGLCSW